MKKFILIPPTYFFITMLSIIGLYFIIPVMNIIKLPYNLIGILFIVIGIILNLWSTNLFKKNDTTHQFKKSTALVIEGPYKYTRNPMYLGMTLILFGISLCCGNMVSLIFPVIFFIIINIMFIPYEENKMKDTFGEAYINYKKQVRRWL